MVTQDDHYVKFVGGEKKTNDIAKIKGILAAPPKASPPSNKGLINKALLRETNGFS